MTGWTVLNNLINALFSPGVAIFLGVWLLMRFIELLVRLDQSNKALTATPMSLAELISGRKP